MVLGLETGRFNSIFMKTLLDQNVSNNLVSFPAFTYCYMSFIICTLIVYKILLLEKGEILLLLNNYAQR